MDYRMFPSMQTLLDAHQSGGGEPRVLQSLLGGGPGLGTPLETQGSKVHELCITVTLTDPRENVRYTCKYGAWHIESIQSLSLSLSVSLSHSLSKRLSFVTEQRRKEAST